MRRCEHIQVSSNACQAGVISRVRGGGRAAAHLSIPQRRPIQPPELLAHQAKHSEGGRHEERSSCRHPVDAGRTTASDEYRQSATQSLSASHVNLSLARAPRADTRQPTSTGGKCSRDAQRRMRRRGRGWALARVRADAGGRRCYRGAASCASRLHPRARERALAEGACAGCRPPLRRKPLASRPLVSSQALPGASGRHLPARNVSSPHTSR